MSNVGRGDGALERGVCGDRRPETIIVGEGEMIFVGLYGLSATPKAGLPTAVSQSGCESRLRHVAEK